jgi:hypothetical protein
MRIFGKGRLLVVAVVVVVAGCATWASISAGQPAGDPAHLSDGADQSAGALASASIGALRRAAQPDVDALPDRIADTPLLSGTSIDLGSARLVRRIGHPIWLASDSDGSEVCEITPGAMACPPVAEIKTRGLSPVLFSRAGEPIHVTGVAADSVTSVDVVLADGSSESVPVIENVFALDVTAWPRGLHWRGPAGPESFDFPQLAR